MLPPEVCDTAPSAIVTEPVTAFTSIVLTAPATVRSPAADWLMLPWASKVTDPPAALMPALTAMLPAAVLDTRLALSSTLPLPLAVTASVGRPVKTVACT